MADTYEVEVKSLLGDQEKAELLKQKLFERDPECVLHKTSSQLNHYFEGGDVGNLVTVFTGKLSEETLEKLARIRDGGSNVSVRSREANEEVRFVVKASVGDDSSANGVARIEIEESLPGVTLDELDALIQEAGYTYQAKWSRAREEYKTGPFSVCLDKNAGYGYLAEFERVVEDEALLAEARKEIDLLMGELGVEELSQDRLERMFAHYNQHWPKYYGTDTIFVIE